MQDRLYSLLVELFDVPLIRAYQNGKEPPKPFATYALRWESQPAHFCYSQNEGKATTHLESTLELQLFGDKAYNLLRRSVLRLKLQSMLAKWAEADITIVEVGKVSDMPFLNEAQAYEDRAVVEIRLRYSESLNDPIDFFNRVEVENLNNHQITLVGVQNGED